MKLFIELKKSLSIRLEFCARMFRVYPLSLIGMIIVLSFAVIALLAPILAPPTSSDPYICPYSGPQEQT